MELTAVALQLLNGSCSAPSGTPSGDWLRGAGCAQSHQQDWQLPPALVLADGTQPSACSRAAPPALLLSQVWLREAGPIGGYSQPRLTAAGLSAEIFFPHLPHLQRPGILLLIKPKQATSYAFFFFFYKKKVSMTA